MTAAPVEADRFRVQRLDGRLPDLLAGKKIVMTGVTGFIGEQLLWKILTELPETRPSVLVRRKGSASARDRMLGVVKKPIFNDIREAAGGASELLDSRIMLTHYSAAVLFSPDARQSFVAPDIQSIPPPAKL